MGLVSPNITALSQNSIKKYVGEKALAIVIIEFFIALALCFSSFLLTTKLLLFSIYLLFGIIFIINSVTIFSTYSLFFLITNFYLTARYFFFSVDEAILQTVLFYFLITLIFITLFSISPKRFSFRWLEKFSLLTNRSYKRKIIILTILYMLLYTLLIITNIQSFSPSEILGQSIGIRQSISSGGFYYLYQALTFLSDAIFLCAVLVDYNNGGKTNYRLIFLIIFLILSIPLGSRGIILFNVLYFLIFNLLLFKKINLFKLFATILCGVIFIAWYGKARSNEDSDTDAMIVLKLVFARFDAIDKYIEVYPYVKHDFSFASSIKGFIVQPIPRGLYPDKPLLYNSYLTEKYFPSSFDFNVTYDFSAFPEAIYNFGKAGLILLGIYIGLALKVINDLFIYSKKNKSFSGAIIYAKFFTYPTFVFVIGWINSGNSVSFVINFFTTLIMLSLISKKNAV